jgi:hypothetical protein
LASRVGVGITIVDWGDLLVPVHLIVSRVGLEY